MQQLDIDIFVVEVICNQSKKKIEIVSLKKFLRRGGWVGTATRYAWTKCMAGQNVRETFNKFYQSWEARRHLQKQD